MKNFLRDVPRSNPSESCLSCISDEIKVILIEESLFRHSCQLHELFSIIDTVIPNSKGKIKITLRKKVFHGFVIL